MLTTSYQTISDETFPVIYNEHYAMLVKYAFVIVRNRQQAQDIVADLFCELWNGRDRLAIHTDLKNYLLVSVRRMANKQADTKQPDFNTVTQQDKATNDPHVKFVHKENNQLLKQLLEQLSPLKREIIEMRLIGLTYKEIAGLLSITPKKVEYHLNTSVNQLHETINKKPELKELSILLFLPALLSELTIW